MCAHAKMNDVGGVYIVTENINLSIFIFAYEKLKVPLRLMTIEAESFSSYERTCKVKD